METTTFDVVYLSSSTIAFSLNRPTDGGLKSMLLVNIVNDLNFYAKRSPEEVVTILAGFKQIIIYNPNFDETFINRALMSPLFDQVFYEELLDLD